jgi:hypothetical protein
MVAMKAGDQTAGSRVAVGDADSEAADELEPGALGGTMFGSVAVRERRSLWTILSILFFLGFVVSTVIVRSERNGAFDSVAKLAQDDAQLITATLTKEQFTTPVRGKSYDELGRKIGKTATRASILGVTVWSSQGQILFSLNQSLVGTTPPDMQPLIVGIAQGSGGTRVVDDVVQTFLPVSKAADGPVAVVQLDQPFAVVEARIGSFWSLLRVALALGLIASLLLLGLSVLSSRSLARAAAHDEPAAEDEGGVDDEGADREEADHEEADMEAEEQPVERLTRELQTLSPALDVGPYKETPLTVDEDIEPAADLGTDVAVDQDADMATDQDEDLAAYLESQEAMRQRRDELKARAREAELRVKKLEAELHAAPSAPKSEQ